MYLIYLPSIVTSVPAGSLKQSISAIFLQSSFLPLFLVSAVVSGTAIFTPILFASKHPCYPSNIMRTHNGNGAFFTCSKSSLTAAVLTSSLATCILLSIVVYLLRHRIQDYIVRNAREKRIEPYTLFSPTHAKFETAHPLVQDGPLLVCSATSAVSPLSFACRAFRITPPSHSPLPSVPPGAAPPFDFVYNISPSLSTSSLGSAAHVVHDALPVSYHRGLSPYSSGRLSAAAQSSTVHGAGSGGMRFAPDPVSAFPTCHLRE